MSCCSLLAEWSQREVQSLPARVLPFYLMDLNDGMGLVKEGGAWVEADTLACGKGRTKEMILGGAGQLMRRQWEAQGIFAINTAQGDCNTWYGAGTARSTIDFVGIPLALTGSVQSSGVLMNMGRRMQHIPSRYPRDHMPVHVVMMLEWEVPSHENVFRQWNKEALSEGVNKGLHREEFVKEVNDRLAGMGAERMEWMQGGEADILFEKYNGLVSEVGAKYFTGRKEFGKGYTDMKREREALLLQRREMRQLLAEASILQLLEELEEKLKEMTKKCKAARSRWFEARKEEEVGVLWQAWSERSFAKKPTSLQGSWQGGGLAQRGGTSRCWQALCQLQLSGWRSGKERRGRWNAGRRGGLGDL